MEIKVEKIINKSQGQSLKHVGVYLPTPIFSYGQGLIGLYPL